MMSLSVADLDIQVVLGRFFLEDIPSDTGQEPVAYALLSYRPHKLVNPGLQRLVLLFQKITLLSEGLEFCSHLGA